MPALTVIVNLFITNKVISSRSIDKFIYYIMIGPTKDLGREIRCDAHSLPFAKIQTNTRRMMCEKCLSENEQERRQRLELQRLKLQKAYLIDLAQLKEAKKETDKLVQLFQARNMTEAKKLINKSSPEVQKLVESLIEKQVKEANKVLREAAEIEVEKWKTIDGKSFGPAYLQFEQDEPRISQRLSDLKNVLKQEIADKLKQQIRVFYCELFEI